MIDRRFWLEHDRRRERERNPELAGDVRAIIGGLGLALIVATYLIWEHAPWLG